MSEKSFRIEDPGTKEQTNYKDEILSIVNGIEEKVRAIEPDEMLHKELHERKHMNARAEIIDFEPVRRDVCESFGVPFDDEHIYIHKGVLDGTQRALRAFFVLIDTKNRNALYGEGRIDHNTLFRNLADKLGKMDGHTTFDSITETFDQDSMDFLVFKGFVSTKEFSELSDSSRRVLETPIVDKSGEIVKTPSTWFLTGHNIPEK